MFGAVPKTLWERQAPPDELNRILMATRSLVIEGDQGKMLVDLGCGDKWTEKTRAIYALSDEPYQVVPGVTDALITHLHFDHTGGVSRYAAGKTEIEPCYPNARHFVSKVNHENACHPNIRERASYMSENIGALKLVETTFTEGGQEIWPGIKVREANGHTRGLHWVTVSDEGVTVAFPTDLFPTSKHLPPPYIMGYDMCAETSLRERTEFLERAASGNWIVVFEHDPEVPAATISLDDRGRAIIKEAVDF